MTAFYTFRMIGMAFFGKKSRHVEEMEQRGHHIHDAGPRMWVPYGILAVASIALGVIGFAFEGQLHHLLGEYLAESFGIPVQEAGRTWLGLNLIAANCICWCICCRGRPRLSILYWTQARSADHFKEHCH